MRCKFRRVASREPRFPGYMNKRGQFFIIAAVFIALILFGTTSIATYLIVKEEPRTIFDLSNELSREAYNVIEYGVYNNENLSSLTDSFVGDDVARYFLRKTTDANIVFIYGNRDNLQALHYRTASAGKINIGGANWEVYNLYSKKGKPTISGNFTEIEVLDKTYSFELKDNEIFYFVIAQKRQDEVFIESYEKPSQKDRPGGGKRK